MLRVLIVDDEKPISDLINMSLTSAGYDCTCVYDGLSAADIIDKNQFDLILLDVMLPGVDGFELMDYIRPKEIPVIFLTAKTSVNDRVKGLKLGAEDYLIKPFEVIELLARVETVLRRTHKLDKILEVGGLTIDTSSRTVMRDGEKILLTKKEFELMLLFVRNPNIALYRETIYERVWESDYMGDSRTVDLHVQRLRKKVGWEDNIKAVYKVGYRFEDS
ncbi:MAG TPA: response regulator transcription factor [Candidatus Butyricicoccus avistercoris]|uniref:Stage 0 sporulation protein A homolog n=1 Tax=Candidatus Butyricicoccus avistercoris TaxID=2838518 RepID=A0A9D1THX2_9FIRM|nr:response regulator transcription factor [Candidatus Butyricicoccus avistercoris]